VHPPRLLDCPLQLHPRRRPIDDKERRYGLPSQFPLVFVGPTTQSPCPFTPISVRRRPEAKCPGRITGPASSPPQHAPHRSDAADCALPPPHNAYRTPIG
jgi:hypothetical protein